MTSKLTDAATSARNGVPQATWNMNAVFQEDFTAVDVITMGTTEATNNVVDLFGGGPNMEGCVIVPEMSRVRGMGGATASYSVKIVRNLNGVVSDITAFLGISQGQVTTFQAATSAALSPLAPGEKLQAVLTSVTQHVAGKQFTIEVGIRRHRGPGLPA